MVRAAIALLTRVARPIHYRKCAPAKPAAPKHKREAKLAAWTQEESIDFIFSSFWSQNASKIALGTHEPAPQHRPHPSPQQPSCSTSSTLHDEGLPLFDDLRQLTLSVHAAANAASDASPPMSPESALNSTFGAATRASEATAAASMSSASRLRHWTVDDDRLLLKHTLYSLGQWQDFAALTDHRHTPDECRARWQLLKQLLFIELDKWTDY
ncbi:hypothetical protein BC940DRAFT_98718 [Gongronella butleri]|nr:hypothetical protein BC940DRAFT_98718 [Gongronella butleri]